ncbi:hornerin-like [Sceloporus undulatus]|uniref:hornerin-like n=1 Tax=Sceloporus undulatus TaxID=8520 RepID=UPI001C4D3A12|nr:hornerin-like [Sceloporus undulatus]
MTSRSRDFSSLSGSSLTSPGAFCHRRRERSYSPSSRYRACHSPIRGDTSSRRNFSSSSLTGYSRQAYPKISVNQRLLTPLHLDIDPSFQEIRNKEKEEIKTLNNQFAALIGKVQSLEQHNQVLITRWNFLKEQDNSLSDLDIKLLYDQYMNRLRLETRSIDNEKEQLDAELDEVLDAMDTVRNKYEEEINKRTGMEFTFTVLKKDLDNGFLHKTELEAKLSGLQAWVELMKNIQEQELEEVMSQVKDVSVVLGIDNNRYNPDPQRIVENVRAQYETLAIRSWEELETLTRSKLNEREVLSVKYGDHLLHDRRVIAELNIQIQKMRSCIVSLKSQCLRLEDNIKDVGVQGETALNDAKAKLAKLEEALHSAKQDLAQLVKEYQELMNIKLALDIEILTYRKLMEGEEISMESPPPAVISRIYPTPKLSSSNSSITTTSHLATRGKEDSTEKMSHSRSSLESGLSRSQSGGSGLVSDGDLSRSKINRSAVTPDGSLSRSHSSMSGSVSEAFRSHSTSHSGILESGPSRSTSNKSGNFADIEDITETSVSRSHSHGSHRTYSSKSGDNLENSLSRSPSSGVSGISDSYLSRSQSNRSGGMTDSVFARTQSGASEGAQEGNCSRSQSQRSVGFSPSSFSRTPSGESNIIPGTTHTRELSSGSRNVPEGSHSRSQSSRSGDLTDSSFAIIHSGGSEGVSESSFHESSSGSSASYVVGSLSRSQSDENEIHSKHDSEGYAEPAISRTRSAEDGGVPVGGSFRSQSGASRDSSGGSLSRSQSDENEFRGSEGHAESVVSRSRSAEDGGVPVSGISRSQSRINRGMSRDGHPSRSQSDKNEFHGKRGSKEYADPVVSRTRSAEDGGVPVGGISRSHSGISRDKSVESNLSRSQSDENEFHGTGGYAEPVVSRTSSTESSEVPVSGLSRNSSWASRNSSQGGFSRNQRGQSGVFADTVFTRARTEGSQEGSLSRNPSDTNASPSEGDISRGPKSGGKDPSEGSSSRTPSIRSTGLTDSVFMRTPSSADQEVQEELKSRIHSGARDSSETSFSRSQSNRSRNLTDSVFARTHSGTSEGGLSRSQNDENKGFIEAKASRGHSRGSGGSAESSVSTTPSDESESVPVMKVEVSRSHSAGNKGIPEDSLSRSQSSRSEGFAGGHHARGKNKESKGSDSSVSSKCAADKSHREADEVVLESGLSKSRGTSVDSFSRSHSDESAGPVETSTPICLRRRNEGAMGHSLSRSHSGNSGSFKAADLSRSSSEVSRGASEASLSRSSSKDNESSSEGIYSRNYSYRCAVESHPYVSRTESGESEAVPEDGLCRTHSSGSGRASGPRMYRSHSGEKGNMSKTSFSRSYSSGGEEASIDNPYASPTGRQEGFPESSQCEPITASCSHRTTDKGVWQSSETGGLVEGSQSGDPSPVCMIYELSSDEHHHPPSGEISYYVESSSME